MSPLPLGILAASGAGASSAMVHIATQVLAPGGTSEISFNSIPQIYQHLQLRILVRSSRNDSTEDASFIRLNGDSASNYSRQEMASSGSTPFLQDGTNQTSLNNIWHAASASSQTGFSPLIIDIYNYTGGEQKSIMIKNAFHQIGAARASIYSGLWRNTGAINSITFASNGYSLVGDSKFSIYGIKGE